jgi:gliding motility-associated-like protein
MLVMKIAVAILCVLAVLLTASCRKKNDGVRPVNCDGLVTDTAGTGDNGRVYMPNAFTPNGDGKNDIGRPLTTNIASIDFTIYDENNNVVFATTTLGQGWNTTIAAGSYAKYYFRIQAITASNNKIGMCGELYKLSCYPPSMSNSFYFEDQLTPFGFTGVTSETLGNCP